MKQNSTSNGIHFTNIRVENTNLCKYFCEMCPREKMTRIQGIMPPQDYQVVLDRVEEYIKETNLPQPFVSDFYLRGYGEPLFDPNLAIKGSMVNNQFPASQPVIFTTLGVPRKEFYLKNLLIEGKLKVIFVSFYGFQEATYNAVQNGGNFHVARKNLVYLATLNNSLGNHCKILLQLLHPKTRNVYDEDPSEQKAYHKLMEIIEPLGVRLTGMSLTNFGNGRDYNDPQRDTSICSVVNGRRQKHLNVSWEIKVLPCCYDYNGDIVLGDLREQSIFEIYRNQKFEKFIDSHRLGNLDDYPLCKGCDAR